MALTDIAANLVDEVPWRTCATCHALNGMSEDDAATLRRLLADRRVKFKHLAKALADDTESPTIPWESLSRHAQAGCSARENLR